jgi:hypothetical protein
VPLPGNIEDFAIVPGDFNSGGLLDLITLPGAGAFRCTRKSEQANDYNNQSTNVFAGQSPTARRGIPL